MHVERVALAVVHDPLERIVLVLDLAGYRLADQLGAVRIRLDPVERPVDPLVQVCCMAPIDAVHPLASHEHERQPHLRQRAKRLHELLASLTEVEGRIKVVELVDDDQHLAPVVPPQRIHERDERPQARTEVLLGGRTLSNAQRFHQARCHKVAQLALVQRGQLAHPQHNADDVLALPQVRSQHLEHGCLAYPLLTPQECRSLAGNVEFEFREELVAAIQAFPIADGVDAVGRILEQRVPVGLGRLLVELQPLIELNASSVDGVAGNHRVELERPAGRHAAER